MTDVHPSLERLCERGRAADGTTPMKRHASATTETRARFRMVCRARLLLSMDDQNVAMCMVGDGVADALPEQTLDDIRLARPDND